MAIPFEVLTYRKIGRGFFNEELKKIKKSIDIYVNLWYNDIRKGGIGRLERIRTHERRSKK